MTRAQKCFRLSMAVCFLCLYFFKDIIVIRKKHHFQKATIEKSVNKNTNLCNNVIAPRRNLSFVWQPIIPDHSYIYSAHIDNRDGKKMIKVFTIIEVNMTENFNLYCHVWFSNASYVIAVKAELEPKVCSRNFK